jgi:hypothetical protein
MRTSLLVAAALLAMLGAGAKLAAHHSFAAEFDGSKPVTLKGTVTQMEWTNPHAWLHIDVKGPDGKTVTWMIEGGAPNALLRRGWNRTSVVAGTAVVVQGYRARDGSNRASGGDLTLPDGKKLFIGSTGTGAPGDRPDAGGKK